MPHLSVHVPFLTFRTGEEFCCATFQNAQLLAYAHAVEWIDRKPVAKKAEPEVIAISNDEPLKMECAHFLHCVATRQTPQTAPAQDREAGQDVLRLREELAAIRPLVAA